MVLALSLALQNLLTYGVNLMDTMMLGRYSQDAMGGVSLCNQVQFLLQMLVVGAGEGAVVMGSQYWGRKKLEPIPHIIGVALRFGGALAVLLFILRVIGILLLVVLILLVLLLLCPFCADLCWEHGVLTVKAGALGITFPVFQYPKPEPPPAPENPEPPKGFGKIKAKFAAWRAERKRKKAEEKARKKAAAAKK